MKELAKDDTYRINRRAGQQGLRPSVAHQAEVEQLATGEERTCQPPSQRTSKLTNSSHPIKTKIETKNKKYSRWKCGQINVQSCSDEFRLNDILLQSSKAGLDIVCMQEVKAGLHFSGIGRAPRFFAVARSPG